MVNGIDVINFLHCLEWYYIDFIQLFFRVKFEKKKKNLASLNRVVYFNTRFLF